MIAMVIEYYVSVLLQWHFASALTVLLIVITVIVFAIYNRVVGLRSLFESKY